MSLSSHLDGQNRREYETFPRPSSLPMDPPRPPLTPWRATHEARKAATTMWSGLPKLPATAMAREAAPRTTATNNDHVHLCSSRHDRWRAVCDERSETVHRARRPEAAVGSSWVHLSPPKSARMREYEAPPLAAHRQDRHAHEETYLGNFRADGSLGSKGHHCSRRLDRPTELRSKPPQLQ
jgi:hypothetical protein